MSVTTDTLASRPVLRRFAEVLLRTPRYAVLATNLARDARLTKGQKAGAAASLGYVFLPVDLLPGFIPVVGQLDDLAVLLGGLRAVLRRLPPEIGREHLARANLTAETLDADLATVGDTARWLGRGGVSLLARAVRGVAGLASGRR
jgi:uncharacterized membrane protein YkvA (DUF1232 family)